MRKIRVLIANTPRLMHDLVRTTLSDQLDMEIVGDVLEESQILHALDKTQPDFLVVSLGSLNQRPQICDQALEKYPHLRVVAIAPDQDSIMYYWLSPEIRVSRIDTSEGGVLNALRGKIDLLGR
jgi:DNA-binding NarL/FixJ family response regulator